MYPAPNPISTADAGPTNPDAGVIATRPATQPEAAPSAVGFPRKAHSTPTQESAAAAAAICVTTNADVASAPEAMALPPLNPNQPNQRIAAPRSVIVMLCGAMGSWPWPFRFPTMNAAASADTPELT